MPPGLPSFTELIHYLPALPPPLAAVHHRALHGSKDRAVFTDQHLLGKHSATDRERGHYRRELMVMRERERQRDEAEAEEVCPGFLQEVAMRNRIDRIRRAARCQRSCGKVV